MGVRLIRLGKKEILDRRRIDRESRDDGDYVYMGVRNPVHGLLDSRRRNDRSSLPTESRWR